nr:conserved hypothetical protein [Bartonella sp. 1-1C]
MHFPDGSTIVFSDSDWDFSLDENDNLIAKSALGPSLSIKASGDVYGFKKRFIDSLRNASAEMRASANQKKRFLN